MNTKYINVILDFTLQFSFEESTISFFKKRCVQLSTEASQMLLLGWGCGLGADHVLSLQKSLGLRPSTRE